MSYANPGCVRIKFNGSACTLGHLCHDELTGCLHVPQHSHPGGKRLQSWDCSKKKNQFIHPIDIIKYGDEQKNSELVGQ